MKVFRLPKTIRWVLGCAFLTLLVMNAYRILLHLYFQADTLQGPVLWRTFWMGFRFDCRYAGGISLLVLLVGFLPGMHIFKRSTGKVVALSLYTTFMALLLLSMFADIASLLSIHARLDTNIIADIITGTERGKLVAKDMPWVIVLIATGLVSMIFLMVIRFLHYTIGQSRSTDNKGMRIYWQTITIFLFLLCLYGRIGKAPLSKQIASYLPTPYRRMLVLNPLECLVSSLGSANAKPVMMPWPPVNDPRDHKPQPKE